MQGQRKPQRRTGKPAEIDDIPELNRVQKRIYRQAALAGLTVVLTIVILFAVTTAWYTNIVQTSGLVFQAEAWGFDGTIIVDTDPIVAAPGDEGVIHLEVQNSSDSIAAISLNVSKANMSDVMKKRLFFYVDTRMSRNGEIMDRVYVNNYEGYTYTLFSQGNLILTEQTNNAPQLKWEWVYDVLGYYVLAQPVTYSSVTVSDGAAADPAAATEPVTRMDIKDYLRPIEYDYDSATTAYELTEDGRQISVLSTVDGNTSPELFLQNLSRNDGYPSIIAGEPTAEGFYPVDVDPTTGYGVYAYLCTPSEVYTATKEDGELAELAYKKGKNQALTVDQQEQISQEAKLTLSAQKNESTAVNVNTHSALQRAITDGVADVIQLGGSIHVSKDHTLVIPSGRRVMLDLNGNKITSDTGNAIEAASGSTLTIINGQMECRTTQADTRETAIHAKGAEVVMSNVEMSGYDYGVYVGDNDGELDSRVHMVGCKINASTCAVFLSGNGLLSEQKSQLIVEKCELSSDSLVISGNGSTDGTGRWGTDIQVIDSTITGNVEKVASGIYQPQKDSTLTVYNSKVSGYNGIAIKGGSVSIIGSTISGLGEKKTPAVESSGFTDTGDAVYIDTSYGYEILLEISDIIVESDKTVSKLTSAYSESLQVFTEDADNVAVKISGGEFQEEQPEAYLAENAVQKANGNVYVVTLVKEEA